MAAWLQRRKSPPPDGGGVVPRSARLRLAGEPACEGDRGAEQSVEDPRLGVRSTRTRRAGVTHGSLVAIFLVAAVALALLVPTHRHPSAFVQILLVLAFAVALHVDVEVGAGVAVPTELVLIPMLFTMPAARVPLAVAAATLVAQIPERLLRRRPSQRFVVSIGNASWSLAPAVVFILWGEPGPALRHWPVAAVALAAQLAACAVVSTAREWLALRVHPFVLVRPLLWVCGVDALLAPVGLVAAVAAEQTLWALFLPLPLLALVAVFAHERSDRLDETLELFDAYRGTAFLLGDLVEADDPPVGAHSRQVAALVTSVCRAMGLDARSVQLAEFAALLHDIGTRAIPASIIEKPGALSPEEVAIMQTHTIEGERLLRPVGGLVAEVGEIVHSCHERWDGRGYPEGLAGEQIPLVARIVCCCDAYDAMCSDRPYRRALSAREARIELISCRGAQFDPAVVDALLYALGPAAAVAG